MAVVFIKSPCVGPGCVYYAATRPGETTSIPDHHVPELDPKCLIVIEATSAVSREPAPVPGSLLRDADWERNATETAEVLRLRQPDPDVVQPVTRRRANVIAGS